ncbi:nitronate monooxygenase [Gordonia sp. LSe1-13]|uniref:Propionate 3-nitronate monooxygenase n=1 Tax=Gordonia sesuvii TaxID=3116777 RepID=A0ABU7MCZ4_9ACTN|nr:nitronate monooxygenase [Gordonia sp. LSe1-13]
MRVGELEVAVPIVCAPMAGGPTKPALVSEVGEAGGLGMLAAGYLTADALEELVIDVESRSGRPYGVNIFLTGIDSCAGPAGADTWGAVQRYRDDLAVEARRHGVEPGEPRFSDEAVDAKIDALARHRPALVSFTFGDPGRSLIDRVHREIGAPVAVTVTSVDEAQTAARSGADALIAQGIEAGGHRGLWFDDPALVAGGPATPTAELVRTVTTAVDLPVIAAGGVTDGAAVRSMIALGAIGAQLGTAFLCVDEAGTGAAHRAALLDRTYRDTVITRAFSGRSARSLRNGFAKRHADAPAAYPQVHHMTKPIRAAAGGAGVADDINLWAGTGWRAVSTGSTSDLMARLIAEFDDAP